MKMTKKTGQLAVFSFLLMLMFGWNTATAQDKIVGTWKTIDDDGETVKSLLEITQGENGKLYGTVVKLFREPDEDQNPKCTKCDEEDSRYNKPVIGMTLLRELERKSNTKYVDGRILDPENGQEYGCYVELVEPNKLKVRGYIGLAIAGRTQYWYRQ